jgi:hypothetical protein
MRTKRALFWIGGTIAVLVGFALAYYHFILDWEGRPICHKGLMLSLLTVMHPSGGDITNDRQPFPNVKGLSQDSIATINDAMAGYMRWTNDYSYVPGLREDDPQDLVLMYFNRPTRWNWHGHPPTIFNEKAWIVIPVDFASGSSFRPHTGQIGECSERVSQGEFCRRLRGTLDFIRTNERPNWQTIVAEHAKLLHSIEYENR